MALEDAVVLAKALRDAAPDAALALYERCRRPRVEWNIAASARLTAGGSAVGAGSPARPEPRTDADMWAMLDWDTPLCEAP